MPAVLTERIGHVLVVTLNRPDRMNAINGEVLVRFYDAMVEADTDDDIRVAIITGAASEALGRHAACTSERGRLLSPLWIPRTRARL